jgi:nucleotide-binding universal stress UspA family protein
MPFKVILWTTDASEPALRALQTAVDMAQTYKADLYALQAVNPVPMLTTEGFVPPAPMSFNVPKYEQELVENTQKALDVTIADKVPEGINVVAEVRTGEPHDVIIDFIKEKKVELVVMATHGRSGISHFFLGSVVEKVLRRTPVPVLTIPPRRQE